MATRSGDKSSATRKRALRRLAREQYETYHQHYTAVLPQATSRHSARGQAWTLLRRDFPDRYVELYIEERTAGAPNLPSVVRGKAWQRATATLVKLKAADYRALLDQARADGHNETSAYVCAASRLRNEHTEQFASLLEREIDLWMFEASLAGRDPEYAEFRRSTKAGA